MDASVLLGQLGPASSAPATQPNTSFHRAQPVPTYNTGSLAVKPRVATVSVPPSVSPPPRDSEKTSRGPGKTVLKPAAQQPGVYMPGLPESAMDSTGVERIGPVSGSTAASPRQMGCVPVGVRETVRVAVAEGRGAVAEGVPVIVNDAVPGAVDVAVPVTVNDAVPVPVNDVPDAVDEDVPLCVDDMVPVTEDDASRIRGHVSCHACACQRRS